MGRKIKKLSFQELVQNNKAELLNDKEAMKSLERRLEERHSNRAL